MVSLRSLTEQIKARALCLGFSLVGVTDASPLKEYPRFVDWIDHQHHTGMNYLATPFHFETRKDPCLLVPGTRSIIVLGLSYALHNPRLLNDPEISLISGYTAGEDYHTRIPSMLEDLLDFMSRIYPAKIHHRVFTDSAPVLERELGYRAGLGWIGRNSCLISPNIGSAFLLSEIFLDQPLEADAPFAFDRCGSCHRCIDACPTGCIQPDRTVDARHCISYHTIENHGEIPAEIMKRSGNWIFGCDICQMVCPWNKKRISREPFENQSLIIKKDQLLQLLTLSDEEFKQRFGNTALARTRKRGLIRNVLIRLVNMGDQENAEILRQFLSSASDPLLVQTAHWALEQKEK